MYFREMIESQAEWAEYQTLLSELSEFVGNCVRYLIDAFDIATAESFKEQCYSHATVLMLVRHVIESIDGVAVLTDRGCAEICGPLLRSAFEGQLGVLYILESDCKRRALSYQVAHAHRKIKMYRKSDPNDPTGKVFRSELKDDPMADVFDRIPGDIPAMIANLEGMLAQPEFAPIEQEWQSIRKKTDAEWFALFGGPRDVRSLAFHLKLGAAYESLYRSWSDVIHAGSGLNHIGHSDIPDAISIRPLRHPNVLENACSLAASFCFKTTRHLLKRHAPERSDDFRQVYMEKLRDRYMRVCKGKLISAPWHKES